MKLGADTGGGQLLLTPVVGRAGASHQRVYEILRKYTEGRRLGAEDLAEVAHLLPRECAPYSKALTDGSYKQPYKHYVAVYKKAERTVKWWVEKGKAATGGPDLPPLDNAAEMPIWWARVMKQRCPQCVIDAARAAAGAPPASVPAVAATVMRPAAPMMVSTPRFEPAAVTSQEQNLQMLKEQLARAREEQLRAENEEPPDWAKIEAKQRKWRELRTEVEKAEEAVFKLRSKQGKMVDLDQLGARLLPMLVTVANSVRSLLTRLRPRLAKAASDEEREQIWQEGIDESFGELIASGFITREQLALSS